MQETSNKKAVRKIDSYVEESLWEQMRTMAFQLRTTKSALVRLGCLAVVANPELTKEYLEAGGKPRN